MGMKKKTKTRIERLAAFVAAHELPKTKVCGACEVRKEAVEFYQQRASGRLTAWCRKCFNNYHRAARKPAKPAAATVAKKAARKGA